jgi:hypothetical protein
MRSLHQRPFDLAGRDQPRGRSRATTTTVAAIGLIVAMAAAEHGVGEIVRRPDLSEGFFIESWPDTAVFDQLSGEPALTVVPDPTVAGVLTIMLSVVFAWVAVRNDTLPNAGAALLVLSGALLLTGGGLAPPLIGALVATTWFAARRQSAERPAAMGRHLASWWRPALAATVVSYLGLFPGTVLLSWWFGVSSALLVTVLGLCAFGGLGVALPAAVSADRRRDIQS